MEIKWNDQKIFHLSKKRQEKRLDDTNRKKYRKEVAR